MDSARLRVRVLASADVAYGQEKESGDQAERGSEYEGNTKDESILGEEIDYEPYTTKESEDSNKDAAPEDIDPPSSRQRRRRRRRRHVSAIQEAQLSPDGTCIFAIDYARTFSVYPIDTDILSETATRSLRPYAAFESADPLWTFSVNPYFHFNDASSTTVLVSRRDQYISLHNALWDVSGSTTPALGSSDDEDEDEDEDEGGKGVGRRPPPVNISTKIASYKLIDHLTEAVIAPTSLVHTHSGKHFLAGERDCIALFDLNYTENPVSKILTIPSRRNKLKGGGYGFKGTISALSISPSSSTSRTGILAAGSRTRYVGLYDVEGSGEEMTHFPLPGQVGGKRVADDAETRELLGRGVSQLQWSACGTYLYVAERDSDVLLMYDMRRFERTLGYCAGRKAMTAKRMGFHVWSSGDAYSAASSDEVWAGGTDGYVRVWRDPQLKEGRVEADETVRVGGEEAPISSTLVHEGGGLAVVAEGSWEVDGGGGGGGGRNEGIVKGMKKGGGNRPSFKEWGGLKILGLGSY
ncbi:hypothetical protein K504DRAFT_441670 [Pleomassaria siparia CBS 279.74]|uniref:WD40 repeat-like protein n=1 Tax=Pleomassaria siparia CBS 279.74 TaxID=1314801 RepID=A0A6G1JW65_9PLEO|nr:hypothetical protein K504DRAFT_441670 [Pleomassaria siparia CBS 279.74]